MSLHSIWAQVRKLLKHQGKLLVGGRWRKRSRRHSAFAPRRTRKANQNCLHIRLLDPSDPGPAVVAQDRLYGHRESPGINRTVRQKIRQLPRGRPAGVRDICEA